MYEKEIKEELVRRLKKKYPMGLVIPEKVFCGHSSNIKEDLRIDVFLSVNNRFIGYEIKSEKDNPQRLVRQIESYKLVFDKIVIITEPIKSKVVGKIIPDFCGLIEVFKLNGKFKFMTTQKAKLIHYQDPKLMLNVLWKKDVYDLLKKDNKNINGLSKRRLLTLTLEKYTTEQLKKYITMKLLDKYEGT